MTGDPTKTDDLIAELRAAVQALGQRMLHLENAIARRECKPIPAPPVPASLMPSPQAIPVKDAPEGISDSFPRLHSVLRSLSITSTSVFSHSDGKGGLVWASTLMQGGAPLIEIESPSSRCVDIAAQAMALLAPYDDKALRDTMLRTDTTNILLQRLTPYQLQRLREAFINDMNAKR